MVTYIAVIIILMKPINTYLLKKWIGNERRKRTLAERMQDENLSDTESVDVKGPPMKRMSSGYNIFTSKMLSSGTRYYYDYNYNFPTRCSITYFNTCLRWFIHSWFVYNNPCQLLYIPVLPFSTS
jgi:hypothetical protein